MLENSLAAKFERSLPTEEEFEKTMSYMERFFRGFIGIVKELDEDNSGKNPAGPGAAERPEPGAARHPFSAPSRLGPLFKWRQKATSA